MSHTFSPSDTSQHEIVILKGKKMVRNWNYNKGLLIRFDKTKNVLDFVAELNQSGEIEEATPCWRKKAF